MPALVEQGRHRDGLLAQPARGDATAPLPRRQLADMSVRIAEPRTPAPGDSHRCRRANTSLSVRSGPATNAGRIEGRESSTLIKSRRNRDLTITMAEGA